MYQGCSLGLERLGVEAVLRRFLERASLVSVLKVEHLGLETRCQLCGIAQLLVNCHDRITVKHLQLHV